MLSEAQIRDYFRKNIHCSQVVMIEQAELLGLDREEAARMAAPFGGGMFRGDTCGAVAGAMIAIGMVHGHGEPGDAAGDARQKAKVAEFQEAFIARHGTTICRELVGYDFSKDGDFDKAVQSGILFERCPGFVQTALEILEKMI